MRNEVCAALGGRLDNGGCAIPPGAATTQTVLVAESLGSKMLFDSIRDIWKQTPDPQRRALADQLAGIRSVFLIANQLPLLDVADSEPALARSSSAFDVSSLSSFIGTLQQARSRQTARAAAPSAPIRVVAFTDPNDLLSYRLPERLLGIDGATIVNVIVSNESTYFGFLERPDNAHEDYILNPFVIDYLINGCEPTEGGNRCLGSRSVAQPSRMRVSSLTE
jgi:hypothetical protein